MPFARHAVLFRAILNRPVHPAISVFSITLLWAATFLLAAALVFGILALLP